MALDQLIKYRAILEKGLLASFTPSIFKGILLEAISERDVKITTVMEWVEGDKSLWNLLSDDVKSMAVKYGSRVGNLDWLTSSWVIDGLKKEHPGLASLFMGWEEASSWLERQIQEIKAEME